jgi:hypothetical protein
MSKRRPGFDRHERDNYPTPWAAVLPLLPHLKPGTRFIEPCAGEGWLAGHLKRAGHICAGAFDLPGHDARTARYDVKGVDFFITNPPWQTRPNNLLHPIIVNLSDQAPAWMLIYSDWLFTSQATPLLPRLKAVVVIGRQKWIAGSPRNTFLTEPQLDVRWGRKRGYCAELRAQGRGPRFTRLSPRVVRYRLDHVQEYEERNTFASNAEAMAVGDDDSPPEAA